MVSSQYGRPEYWQERYMHKKEQFDWYQKWTGIKDVVTQYVSLNDKVLHVGCGNSKLAEEMVEEGYTSILNIDKSSIVIEDMQELYKGRDGLSFECKDVMNMNFDSGSFDAVIEKGSLDSILCGDRSNIMAKRMLTQIHRVLKADGIYISISYAPPENRLRFFNQAEFTWNIFEYRIAKPILSTTAAMSKEDSHTIHYVYVCIKKRRNQFDEEQED